MNGQGLRAKERGFACQYGGKAPTHERETMKPLMRLALVAFALALGVAGQPAAAQTSAEPAPPADESIGPEQLRDFTLNGTVTRRAEPPAQPPPEPRAAQPRDPAPQPRAQSPPPDPSPGRVAEPSPSERLMPFDLPPPTPADRNGAADPSPDLSRADSFRPEPAGELAPAGDSGSGIWPWLLVLFALAGAAAFYFRRLRPAPAGGIRLSELVAADTAPPPVRPVPPPTAPPTGAPSGIVSTRLRPWLDIAVVPERAVIEQERATVAFTITVFNSGGAPARDVLVEAAMFNAGPAQDQEIGAFFAHPVGKGERIAVVAPLQRIVLQSAVSMPRAQMRQFEVAGRMLFVPLLGINALYRWSGGDGQTSASHLVGKDTGAEKLAPLRLDLGPRIFRGLGAREHALRVRK